uniref:non-specific serine/threonine protein kinase n=1 Tax=Triticum urartu TaxID=4572 RepID=A0A8R7VBW8_TRIUA
MCSCRRPSATTALVLVLLWLYYTPCRTFSLAFNLNFSDPSAFSSIITAGDASISAPTLELTKNARQFPDIRNSVGQATFAHKVQLWSSSTGEMASFTTNFSFQITPAPGAYNIPFPYGDGMAFFLGHFPTAIPQNSSGRNLGLLTDFTAGIGDGRIVAVEFDTYSNPIYDDINGNHVGIDVNSLYSMASTDTTTSPGKNLSSSIVMEATVTYHNDTKMLAVDLLISDALYRVNATVDLSRILPEEVAVGFSAATGLSAAGPQQVLSWSFSSTLPDLPTSNSYKKLVKILLSVLVPVLFFLVCAVMVWRRHRKIRANEHGQEQCVDRAGLERGVAAGGPGRYTYRELVAATSNFAEEKKLGRCGFGGVYGGHLTLKHAADSRAVAVKMLSAESSAQGRREFEAEVRIISRLKHRNDLVQLLGWCDSRKGLLLVYELVMEGSLDRYLYNNDRCLTWPQRYKIILGLGSALRYLHREWEQCIVHGDIKPSNIMLDSSLNTKLGDFGLARLVDHGTG